MRTLELFRSGEELTAKKLNILVEEVKRLQNIQADRQSDIEIKHTKNGLLIGRRPLILVVDDKYLLDSPMNISTRIERRADLKRADLSDFYRIRAVPGGSERPQGISKTLPAYRLMQFIDSLAGWVTDAGRGFQYIEKVDKHGIAPPISLVAQWSSLIRLTEDDVVELTADGDGFTYVNFRHDAHAHLNPAHDGRIFFTLTDPDAESTGIKVLGEMVGDHTKANDPLSELKRETVEWRPQTPMPGAEYSVFDWECYEPLDTLTYRFPPISRIPSSSVLAHEFVNVGKPAGYSSHAELHDKVDPYGVGIKFKYSAENLTGGALDAYFIWNAKIINDGGDLSTAGMSSGSFTISVPAGNTEQDVVYADVPLFPNSQLSKDCLIIFRYIVRNYTHVNDTLTSRLLVTMCEPKLMTVPEPP